MGKNNAEIESYISHISAAIRWEIPYLHVVLGYPSAEALAESQTKEHWSYCHLDLRRAKKDRVIHVQSLPLPGGAVRLYQNEWVASPELVFLNLASELNFHQSVLLGMQLCSSHLDGSKPLTTTTKLMEFLRACTSQTGRNRAIKAARYLADNSWSIMESLLYMLLTLPNQYGGYGLKGAQLNYGLTLKKKSSWQKSKRVIADLYWQEPKLVLEYDSNEFHNSTDAFIKDSRRLATIESSGYRTLAINTAQVYNDAALAEVAQAIAQHLNMRIRIRATDFTKQKALLRGLLPRQDAVMEG